MGIKTTEDISLNSLSTNFPPQVERTLNELIAILETSGKSVTAEIRSQMKIKLGFVSGGLSVIIDDARREKKLSSVEIADLQLLQKQVRDLMTKATVETNTRILLKLI